MTKDEALQMCLEYIETDAHERKYVRHAIKQALVRADERDRAMRENAYVQAEREACAKVCENWTQTPETTGMELALCAAAIRARETK
jgi:hypothetical protein